MPGRFWQLPGHHPLKWGVRLLTFAAIVFLAICVFLYTAQNRLIYIGSTIHFTPEAAQQNAQAAGLIAWNPQATGDPIAWVRPDFRDPTPRGTIVVLHGNGECAWNHAGTAEDLRERGFRTFLYEYPGYGGRPGTPSERTIVPEVQEVIRSLDKAGLGPIYLWGQSLGSGVAAAACADESLPVQGLLLITPFDTLPNAGAAHYPFIPVHWLMIDRYNSVANLAHFQHPVCLARAEDDEVVPPRLSHNLYDHLPGPKKEIVLANSHHNDWPVIAQPSWLDEALDFIAPRK